MGYLIKKKDALKESLQDVHDMIKELHRCCNKWRNDLCDTYNSDDWYAAASEWLRKEVKITIEWLDHLMEWGDHFTITLTKIYNAISKAYDNCTEKELGSNKEIDLYLDKANKRCKAAHAWYEIALTIYKNFGKILSDEATVEEIDELVNYDNQLFGQLSEKCDEYDENDDGFWKK